MSDRRPATSFDLSLYLVTDARLCAETGIIDTVLAAVRGGVTMVQLRDKEASDAELITQARKLMAALRGSGVPLIINDRLEVALAAMADGLHIGQGDGDVAEARRKLGPDAILGLSVENRTQLSAVNAEQLDYLGLGPVFATTSKQDHALPLGVEGLTELVTASPLANGRHRRFKGRARRGNLGNGDRWSGCDLGDLRSSRSSGGRMCLWHETTTLN